MKLRVLFSLLLLTLLTVPAQAADCHQAAFIGPVHLTASLDSFPGVLAAGDVLLADGTVLADGTPITPDQHIVRGDVRNGTSTGILLTLGDGSQVFLGPQETVAVTTEREIDNELVCVCECYCGSDDDPSQIRCESSTMDCGTLNGETCENEGGGESELEECERKYVKVADAEPVTP